MDLTAPRIVAFALAAVAILAAYWTWRRWRERAYLIGLEAAFWSLLVSSLAGVFLALVGAPRFFATAIAAPAIIEGFRVVFAYRNRELLQSPRGWLFLACGFATLEVAGKLILAGWAQEYPILIAPVLPALIQVFLSLSACAMLRSGVHPVAAFAVNLVIGALYWQTAAFPFALIVIVLVLLIAGILKWGERFAPVTNPLDRASTPP